MKQASAFLVLVSVASGLLASPGIKAQATLGVRGGLSLATFSTTQPGDYNDREAVNLGVFLDLPLSEAVGLQLGAGYSGKGAETAYSGDGGESVWGKVKTRIGYVEVPALLRLRAAQVGTVSTHFLFGPTLSFKVSCEVEATGRYWGDTSECDDAGLDVRKTDLGATGGVGVEVGLSDGLSLVGESFYTLGLRTVAETGDGVKNRVFFLSLGLTFPLG